MKSAQFTDTSATVGDSGLSSATSSLTGPTITGGVSAPLDGGTGLTYRDKVQH